jgi:proline dehydrogenase
MVWRGKLNAQNEQTALVPHARALTNLSSYLIHSRPPLSTYPNQIQTHTQVPFPGCARSTDLDVLHMLKAGAVTESVLPPPLTQQDITALEELHSDLVRICTKAQERGVKVVIDAEYRYCSPYCSS